jgi:hypothetical protein
LYQESNQKHGFLSLTKDTVGEDLLTHGAKLAETTRVVLANAIKT